MILIDSHISGSKVKVIPLVLTLRVVCSISNEPFVADLIPAGFQLVDHMVNYRGMGHLAIFTTMEMIPNCKYNFKICYRAKCLYNICSEIKFKIVTSFIPVTHIFLVYSLTDWARRKAI